MSQLSDLAVKFGTDKWNHHWYTEHYAKALIHLNVERFNLLEIGIGGYEFPDRGGASLNMWAEFFTNAKIVGFDFYDKSGISKCSDRIKVVQGDQYNENDLKQLTNEHGPFHVIVDDGSHMVQHQIKSFEVLFPLMPDGGIYMIEDTETSYWPEYGGGDIEHKHSCIAYFMHKLHEMHYRTNGLTKHDPFTDTIESIQFFNNIIIIRKGYNA